MPAPGRVRYGDPKAICEATGDTAEPDVVFAVLDPVPACRIAGPTCWNMPARLAFRPVSCTKRHPRGRYRHRIIRLETKR